MPNVLSRATAEGLPSLTRRLFLRGAAVAAPLAAVPALAAAAEAYAEENPALLTLESELADAEAEIVAAAAARDEAYRIGSDLWPSAPDEITFDRRHAGSDIERDIDGTGYRDGPGLRPTAWLRLDVRETKRWRKMTPEREEKRLRAVELLAIAEKYDAECAHAKAVSGYPEASARYDTATEQLRSVINRIDFEPARTMAGVRIKARAFGAWEHAPRFLQLFNAEGPRWCANFARTVAEIMETAR